MWGRLKGQVLRSRDEVDISDDDTIISRALLRFYEPEVPSWLASSNTNAVMQHQVYESASSKSPSPIPQSYSRRGSSIDRPRMFERSDSFATPASSTTSSQSKSKGSSSGLASRLKNSQW